MLRYPVFGSSNIKSAGYEAGTLEIEFQSGEVHQYIGVPETTYFAFLNALSKGKFFATHIKGRYKEQ